MPAGVFEGDGLVGRMGVGWQKIVPFDPDSRYVEWAIP